MARIKLGVTVVGIRGSIGGITFSANRSGPHARILPIPRNPRTTNQTTQRGYLSTMGAKWRSIGTTEQENWNAFAATPPETDYNSLGETYLLSGFGWFTRICTRRLRTGQVEDLLAPTSTPTAPPQSFDLDLHPGTGLDTDATFLYTNGDFTDMYAILQLSFAPGLGSNVQTTRYINCWEAAVVGATSTDFGIKYTNVFGSVPNDARFFGKLYRQSASGIRSTPLTMFTDVYTP